MSLYQILPKRAAGSKSWPGTERKYDKRVDSGDRDRDRDEAGEFPLRLLDIRRIDLNSNGWETFYVKRAVVDWLRDSRLNLGECWTTTLNESD